jgi:hypothetical protein
MIKTLAWRYLPMKSDSQAVLDAPPHEASVDVDEPTLRPPMLVIIGSLSGASRKDAMAYAKGLAEGQCIALDEVRVGLWKDKIKGRWVYEVHEGGEGLSYLEPLIKARRLHNMPYRITLTDGRSADISEFQDEIVTVIYPPNTVLKECASLEYSDTALEVLRPDGRFFLKCTAGLFVASLAVFLISCGSTFALGYAFKQGWIVPSIKQTMDNRVNRGSIQLLDELERAKDKLSQEKRVNPRAYISRLTYEGISWKAHFSQVEDIAADEPLEPTAGDTNEQ